MTDLDISAPFWDHVEELRHTLIRALIVVAIGFVVSFLFYHQVYEILKIPLSSLEDNIELVVLGPTDGLMATIKTCFWVALVGTSPIWVFFVLNFVAPALQSKEQRLIFPFLFFSFIFLSLGFMFSFYVTIPVANQYLQAFNQNIGVNLWSIKSYLDYTVVLLLGSGLAFELCLILIFLVHYGRISAKTLVSKRRYAIVAIFVTSAVLTPPDVVTQMLLAFPLIALYELTVVYARIKKLS